MPKNRAKTKYGQTAQSLLRNGSHHGLVHNTEHNNNILVLRLADKLSQGANVVECALGVGDAHHTIEEINLAKVAGVIPPILGAGDGVDYGREDVVYERE
jgi:hypothetical protein